MPNWDQKGFQLDKDLRVLGNKEYGPDTCSFVPPQVNAVFTGGCIYKENVKVKLRKVRVLANNFENCIHPEVYENLFTIKGKQLYKLINKQGN